MSISSGPPFPSSSYRSSSPESYDDWPAIILSALSILTAQSFLSSTPESHVHDEYDSETESLGLDTETLIGAGITKKLDYGTAIWLCAVVWCLAGVLRCSGLLRMRRTLRIPQGGEVGT